MLSARPSIERPSFGITPTDFTQVDVKNRLDKILPKNQEEIKKRYNQIIDRSWKLLKTSYETLVDKQVFLPQTITKNIRGTKTSIQTFLTYNLAKPGYESSDEELAFYGKSKSEWSNIHAHFPKENRLIAYMAPKDFQMHLMLMALEIVSKEIESKKVK